MKGVILAGGSGTRLHPLTRITNKHLLPLYDKPMIYYPLQTLAEAGIDEIMLVTGGNNAGDFLRLLGDGHEFGLKQLNYAYQEHAGGIAEAIGLARRFVDGDKFVCMLGDNIVDRSIRTSVENFERQTAGARILLTEVEHPQSYGVPIIEGGRILFIQEKPQFPRSNYAVTGIYLYDTAIWDILTTLTPSGRGELEVTDVNNAYIDRGVMEYDILDGWWGDAGESIETYYETFRFLADRARSPAPAGTVAAI
ncbi:MAG TPA: sugar phosphate nucleotidyltransferase [Chloroflexota bacterium]|nr:sugar phosphate nucleotidyltransferase [Chloroflexota bacterium]